MFSQKLGQACWDQEAEDRQHLRLCRHPTADVMSKISLCGANGGADGGSLLRVLWPRLLCWAPWACEGLDPIPELLPSGLASHINTKLWHSSVQFSCSVVSDYLRPHESQRARPPCPSPTPRVHSDSRPSSQRCHPAISSSVVPFSSCPQSLPASESFPMSQLSHEVAKVLEFQLWHHSFQRNPRADLLQNGLVGSPCSPRDSQESSPTPLFKSINSSALSLLHSPTLTSIHDHRKNHSLTRWTFVGKVMSLLLNMLSRLVITFLPRSKRLLKNFMAAVTICSDFGAPKNKV